jgi:hypothetical protein
MKRAELVAKLEAAMAKRIKLAPGTREWYLAGVGLSHCQINIDTMQAIVEEQLQS